MLNPQAPAQSQSWILAHEELRLILTLLQRTTLLGLEPDPNYEQTVAAMAYGLAVAERTLRARELARIGPDGRLQIALPLLEAVGVAALANQALALHQVAAEPDGARFDRLVLYHLGDKASALTVPEAGLVRVTTLRDIGAGLDLCVQALFGSAPVPRRGMHALTVTGEALASARGAAPNGPVAAQEHLPASPAGRALAEFLARGYRLDLFQVLDLLPGPTVAERQVSLARNQQAAWLMWQATTNGPYELATTGSAELRETLSSLVIPAPGPEKASSNESVG